MPQRKKDTLQIRQLLLHLRANRSEREISHDTGLARDTIRRYKKWAKQHHLLEGEPLPEAQQLQSLLDSTLPPLLPPQNTSSVEPYADLVATLLAQNIEMAALHARLKERGYAGSYSSVYRYVCRTRVKEPDLTLRMETPPGYEAQVDFGEVGKFVDPHTAKPRKT